jgi:hypothetical protein
VRTRQDSAVGSNPATIRQKDVGSQSGNSSSGSSDGSSRSSAPARSPNNPSNNAKLSFAIGGAIRGPPKEAATSMGLDLAREASTTEKHGGRNGHTHSWKSTRGASTNSYSLPSCTWQNRTSHRWSSHHYHQDQSLYSQGNIPPVPQCLHKISAAHTESAHHHDAKHDGATWCKSPRMELDRGPPLPKCFSSHTT